MYYWRSPPQRQPSAGSAGLTDRLYQVQASLPPGALTSLVSEDEIGLSEDEIGRTGKLFPPPTIFLRNASGMERSQRRGSRAGPSLILCTQIHLLVLGPGEPLRPGRLQDVYNCSQCFSRQVLSYGDVRRPSWRRISSSTDVARTFRSHLEPA